MHSVLRSPRGWDETWLRLAESLARSRSKDPSTKVGAIVVSLDNVESFHGYNGFPSGFEDRKEWWERTDAPVGGDTSSVFAATELTKYDIVIHAEMNAILKAHKSLGGWTLYCTHFPCENCAKHIVAAGISRVVVRAKNAVVRMAISRDKVDKIFYHGRVELHQC